jgi:hypothetical protein
MTTQSTAVKSTDGADRGGSLTFRTFPEDSKFFFTLYHAGKVNIILHLVSFSFLFYGLAVKNVLLVLIGLFVFDEMGHAYNYFFLHNREARFGVRMIPYQLLYALWACPSCSNFLGGFEFRDVAAWSRSRK